MINAKTKIIKIKAVLRKQRLNKVATANEFAAWLEGNEKLLEQIEYFKLLVISIMSCGRT